MNEEILEPVRLLAEGGELTPEQAAKKFLDSLSPDQISNIKAAYKAAIQQSLAQEQATLQLYENQMQAIIDEGRELWDREKEMEYQNPEKEVISKRRQELRAEQAGLKVKIRYQQNKVKAQGTVGGELVEFTDAKGLEHKDIPSFRNVSTEMIGFDEETILIQPIPDYIPIIDEDEFRKKGYVFDAIRRTKDEYILSTNGYIETIKNYRIGGSDELDGTHPIDEKQGYVLVTLDQLVLINDYYFIRAKALNQKEADDKNLRTEQYYDSLPEARRASILNQPNYYSVLPATVKKKITKDAWDNSTLAEKESFYKPFKRTGVKRLSSRLEDTQMWASFHYMYERFIDPEAKSLPISRIHEWIPKGLITEDGVKATKERFRGDHKIGHPEVFEYWHTFREYMKWKIKDIHIQREALSEVRKIALETSFGDSNTNDTLLAQYGILVKRQNGSNIQPVEIEQIKNAWVKIQNLFGGIYNLAREQKLKISHTGDKYVFASKAAGMYVSNMRTIAVSGKYGVDQFSSILAHEVSHWIDNTLGTIDGKRYATDNYESAAGKIAFLFRDNMNAKSESDYTNATKECFARALEQYFAITTFGDEAMLIFSNKPLSAPTLYFAQEDYVNKQVFYLQLAPMIKKFLSENLKEAETIIEVESIFNPVTVTLQENPQTSEQKLAELQLQKLKLTNKALSQFPNSKMQLGTSEEIDKINSEIKSVEQGVTKNDTQRENLRKVVLDEGDGIIINDLFNEWNNIKDEKESAIWKEKIKNTKFGTYGTIGLIETINKFNPKLNEVIKRSFYDDIEAALDIPRNERTYKPYTIERASIKEQPESGSIGVGGDAGENNAPVGKKITSLNKIGISTNDAVQLVDGRKSIDAVLQKISPELREGLKSKISEIIEGKQSKVLSEEESNSIRQQLYAHNGNKALANSLTDQLKSNVFWEGQQRKAKLNILGRDVVADVNYVDGRPQITYTYEGDGGINEQTIRLTGGKKDKLGKTVYNGFSVKTDFKLNTKEQPKAGTDTQSGIKQAETSEIIPEKVQPPRLNEVAKYSDSTRYNSEIKVGEKYYDNRYGDFYTIEKMIPFGDADVTATLKYDKGKTIEEKGSYLLYHIDSKQHSLAKEETKKMEETPEQTKTEFFDLPIASTLDELDANVISILSRYSGRIMANIQVVSYLREKGSLGKEYLAKHNLSTKEEFDKWLTAKHAKARAGKGAERKASLAEGQEEINKIKAEAAVDTMFKMGLEQSADMDKKIAEHDVKEAAQQKATSEPTEKEQAIAQKLLDKIMKKFGGESKNKYHYIYDRITQKIAPDLLELVKTAKHPIDIHGKSQYELGDALMPLYLQVLGVNEDRTRIIIAMTHIYIQNGDSMKDPDMEIRLDTNMKTAEALSFYMDGLPNSYQHHVYITTDDGKEAVNLSEKQSQNSFLNKWTTNIVNQGHKIKFESMEEEEKKEAPIETKPEYTKRGRSFRTGIPNGVFYAEIKPLLDGEKPIVVRVSPDEVGGFVAGYEVYSPIKSTKRSAYFKEDEFLFRLENGEYKIISKEQAIQAEQIAGGSEEANISVEISAAREEARKESNKDLDHDYFVFKFITNDGKIKIEWRKNDISFRSIKHLNGFEIISLFTNGMEVELPTQEAYIKRIEMFMDKDRVITQKDLDSLHETTSSTNKLTESDKKIMADYPNAKPAMAKIIYEQVHKILERNPTSITPDERKVLELYEGKGSIKGLMDKGILHQYYTHYILTQKVWELAYKFGLPRDKEIKVLEPSVGTGRFFKFAPSNAELYAFDTDAENAQITKLLYPKAIIYQQEFETSMLEPPHYNRVSKKSWLPQFDIVVGNPPYGEYMGYYKSYVPKLFKRFEMLFIFLSLKLLKPKGLLIFVVSQNFMNNGGMYNAMKQEILKMSTFEAAYRLPNGVFATTEVGTDIIVLRKK